MNSKYTVDNFVMEEVIMEDCGTWVNDNPYYYGISEKGKFNINYSSILTFLIQKAGTICKHYASDLFITWNTIEKLLHISSYDGGKFLFGFREMGVDHNGYVFGRYDYGNPDEIKELYMLEINVEKTGEGYLRMTMTLGKAKFVENPENI